jgi:hypothetical protein
MSAITTTVAIPEIADLLTIISASISPEPAVAGTTRTLTIVADSNTDAALTFGAPSSAGVIFTPVGGQPPGQAQWTFVY